MSSYINVTFSILYHDGTSNAQIKLSMSTMGIGIEKNGELFYSIILHPFERKIFWAEKGKGAFSSKLEQTKEGLNEDKDSIRKIFTDVHSVSAKESYAWVDSLYNQNTTIRKTEWISMMQKRGLIQNVRMTGSNLDYSTKIAEGRGHFQLTDAVGGYFDLCGALLIDEAGGRMVNLEGKNPKPGDQIALAVANPRDLEKVLEITRLCYGNYEGFREKDKSIIPHDFKLKRKSLEYSLFGRPHNLEEFLDKVRNSRTMKIDVSLGETFDDFGAGRLHLHECFPVFISEKNTFSLRKLRLKDKKNLSFVNLGESRGKRQILENQNTSFLEILKIANGLDGMGFEVTIARSPIEKARISGAEFYQSRLKELNC